MALVHHDPVDPGLQAAAALEAREHAVDLQEDVLRDVARLLGVAEQPNREVEDHVLVQSDEAREGVGVALSAQGDEAAFLGATAGLRRRGLPLETGQRDLG